MSKQVQRSIQLKDNTSLTITIFPTNNPNDPVLVLYPAFGVKATYYARFAQQLNEVGIKVVTADLRGHGLSSVRPGSTNNYGFLEMISDLKAISDTLKVAFPKQKIYLLGHSLGGQVASLMVAKYPTAYDGLAMIGAPNVYYKGWSGFHYYRRKVGLYLLPFIGRIVDLLPKFKIGGYYTTQTQMQEWGYTGKTGNYKVVGDNFNYEQAMEQVVIPVLAIDIEGDLMAPKVAIANLHQKFKSTSNLTVLTLTKAATQATLSHINWPRTADKMMVKIIRNWIMQFKRSQRSDRPENRDCQKSDL